MPYNPDTDRTVVVGIPYKKALKHLSKKVLKNTERNVAEKLIAQACQSHGFRVSDFESKNEPKE